VTMPRRSPGPLAQVAALLRLRAAGLRGQQRTVTLAGLASLPLIGFAALITGTALPDAGAQNALLLTPTAWLGFALTSLVAAVSSGARTLLPRDQAVVFPVSPLAEHLGTLLLLPLNAAWLIQSTGLLVLTGWAFSWAGSLGAGIALTLLWMLTCGAVAQSAGWAMELARTTRAGPWAVRGAGGALAVATTVLALTGTLGTALDHSPTLWFVASARPGAFWFEPAWLTAAAALAAVSLVTIAAGAALVAVLQRRTPRDQVRMEARRYPARPLPSSSLMLALRVDRASVWRSAPLRRGLITLAAIPGAAAALAGLDWDLLVLLPGLAASGAGLLFGVNALCLDGPGAVWRETLPGTPGSWLGARLIVITEVCLLGGLQAAAIGAIRAPGPPTAAEGTALLGALLASTAQVVGRCARWSLAHPYASTLRDARDHPAPPAAMAGYSARLALTTTFTGLAFSLCARWGLTLLAMCLTVAACCLGARSVVSSLRRWNEPAERSRVIAAVSA
jgi:hypothetical protein